MPTSRPLLAEEDRPSFDCDEAESNAEEFICRNERAARADLQFADFWAEHVAQIKDHPFADEMIAAQITWLWSRRDGCIYISDNYWQQQTCFVAAYNDRQNGLSHAHLVPAESDGATWEIGWGANSGIMTITEAPASLIDFEPARRALIELTEAEMQVDLGVSLFPSHIYKKTNVVVAHGERLSSIRRDHFLNLTPSAHPSDWSDSIIFDRVTGQFIDLGDIFLPEHYEYVRRALLDGISAATSADFSGLDMSLTELGFGVTFDESGRLVAFENYALANVVTSRAARACYLGIIVPAADLAPYASPNYTETFSTQVADVPPRGINDEHDSCRS